MLYYTGTSPGGLQGNWGSLGADISNFPGSQKVVLELGNSNGRTMRSRRTLNDAVHSRNRPLWGAADGHHLEIFSLLGNEIRPPKFYLGPTFDQRPLRSL